jgi:hypothetical protein
MHRKSIFFVLIVLIATILACGGTGGDSEQEGDSEEISFSFSTAEITDVKLAGSFDDATGTASDFRTTFSPDDEVVVVVDLSGAPDGTKLKFVWTLVDNGEVKDQVLGENEVVIENSAYSPPVASGLSAGEYKVDVYLNDKLDRTVDFTVG